MNKKGISFFILGMLFVIFMGFLGMLAYIGTEFVRFETYAGKNANDLSIMQYESYLNTFYIEMLAREIIPHAINNSGQYLTYIVNKYDLREEEGSYIIRNETIDYFRELQDYRNIQEWSTKQFNSDLQKTHAGIRGTPVDPPDVQVPTYQLYLEEQRITGISETQKNITSEKGIYYYWPHIVVYTDAYSKLQEKIQLMIDTFIEIQIEQPEQDSSLFEEEVRGRVPEEHFEKKNQVLLHLDQKLIILYDIEEKEVIYIIGDTKLKAVLDQEDDTSDKDTNQDSNDNLDEGMTDMLS